MATSTAPGKRSVAVSKERRDALSEVLADGWWAVGLRGIIGILFGLICLLTPGIAFTAFIFLFVAYMLVDGAFALAAAWKAARSGDRWAPLILEGIVDIAAALIAFRWPVAAAVAFIWVVAIWALISGGLMLYAAFTLNREHGRWWLALGGICSLIFGALLVIEPLVGAVVLTMWVGAYALVFGIFLLILAFQLHSRKEEREHKAPAAAKKA